MDKLSEVDLFRILYRISLKYDIPGLPESLDELEEQLDEMQDMV